MILRRLSSLGSKQLKVRKGRSALTAIGIVLGVAILFGVLVANATTNTGFEQLIEDFTGRADVLVSPSGSPDSTMPEEISAKVRRLPDVEDAVGSHRTIGSSKVAGEEEPVRILVSGITLREERKVHNFDLSEGRFFRDDAKEAVIPRKLAVKLKLRRGDTIEFATVGGIQTLPIVGILEDTGAARANEGNALYTSLPTSRGFAGEGAVIRLVSVMLKDGTEIDPWIRAHEGVLGPGFDFENAETLIQEILNLVRGIQSGFTTFSAIALFIGAFLIYLTLTMAVVERAKTYGTLRALGATRGQVRRIVIAEALVLGVVATAVGLVLGLLIAKGLLVLIAGLFEIEIEGLTVPPFAFGIAVGVGIVTTLVSSLVPARRAARLSPVEVIRGGELAKPGLSKFWILGAFAVAGGIWLSLNPRSTAQGIAGTLLILFGAVLLVPLLLRPLAAVVGFLTRRMASGGGRVGVLHLVKERSRSAYTLALIMVVMAMIFANGAIQASLQRSFSSVLDRAYGADLIVGSSGVRFNPEVESELRNVDGVDEVTPIWFAQTLLPRRPGANFTPAGVQIVDPASYFDVEGFVWEQGNEAVAKAALAGDDSILLSDSLATSAGKRKGSKMTLRTLRGDTDFRVAATYRNAFGPDLFMGIAGAKSYLGAQNPSQFHVNFEEGSTLSTVRSSIEKQLGDDYHLNMETASTVKDEFSTQLHRFSNIFLAILLVAAIIGLLGLANTLAMSVTQRSREIGVLRAIGSTRGQVRRMVLVESITLGLVAFLLSLPLGYLLSIGAVAGTSDSLGFEIDYVYPAIWVPLIALFGVIVALVAALAPARRAGRMQIVETLRFE